MVRKKGRIAYKAPRTSCKKIYFKRSEHAHPEYYACLVGVALGQQGKGFRKSMETYYQDLRRKR